MKYKARRIILIVLIFSLCLFGLLMIYSASFYNAGVRYGDTMHFVKKQAIGLILGVAGFVFTSLFDYHKYYKLRYPIIIVSIVLLMLVFIPGIGIGANGARRWIGVGGFNLQSSEVAKFGFVIFASCYLSKNYDKMDKFKYGLPVLIAGGVICLLILLEPNLSVTLCVGSVMLIMLFVGGLRLKHMLMLIIPAVLMLPVLIIMEPYRLQRLFAFLDPWKSPLEEGFQLIQSLYSLGAGGLFGVGLFNSRQKYMFLPFSESDFIFSIIGEEFGLVGCIILIVIYLLIVYIGIRIAHDALDRLGVYLATGITAIIAVQTAINVAVVTGTIPPTGIPLPFISAGGTSVSVFLMGMGILCNVARQKENSCVTIKLKKIKTQNFKQNKIRSVK